jgi:ribonuclease Z
MIDICLLGCGGMMPLPNRWLSSLLLRYNGNLLMIDCGEGTQIPMKLTGWGFKAVNTILFTHMHADHISGLPGFLLTLGNSGKDDKLNIYGPRDIQRVYNGLTVICPDLPYTSIVNELKCNVITDFEVDGLEIKSIPVEHRTCCLAYVIELKRPGKFDIIRAKEKNIPIEYWKRLQLGETIHINGNTYKPDMVLGPPRKGIKIAYCTDTRPTKDIVTMVNGADIFICEGNYGEDEKLQKAIEKKHMLFSEAATIAKEANVKELILTHFSPALDNPNEFINNARSIFENTHVGKNLLKRTLVFEN